LEFADRFSKKSSNINFHKNPPIWNQIVPCRRTNGRTDMTKAIVAFRCFVKAPKNHTRQFFSRILSTHRPLYRLHLKKSLSSFHSILLADGPALWNTPRNISPRFFPVYLPQTILMLFFQVLHKRASWHNVVKLLEYKFKRGNNCTETSFQRSRNTLGWLLQA